MGQREESNQLSVERVQKGPQKRTHEACVGVQHMVETPCLLNAFVRT